MRYEAEIDQFREQINGKIVLRRTCPRQSGRFFETRKMAKIHFILQKQKYDSVLLQIPQVYKTGSFDHNCFDKKSRNSFLFKI